MNELHAQTASAPRSTHCLALLLALLVSLPLAVLMSCNNGNSTATGATFTLTYDGNGNTSGTAPTAASLSTGATTTAAAGTSLARTGYTFVCWNPASDGSGTNVNPGDTITMGAADMTMYAVWQVAGPPTYTVTYDGNGNTGGTAPVDSNTYQAGATVTVLTAGSLVRTSYAFNGFNTAANGSGTSQAASSTFTMGSANVTLYAQWTPPAQVTLVPGDAQIAVSWTPVAGATDYRVYYNTVDSVGSATLLNDTVGIITSTSATITGLANSTLYYVWAAGMVSNVETFVTASSENATPSAAIFSPVVSSIEPGENAIEVALDKQVIISFNQALQSASVNTTNVTVDAGGPVAVAVAVGVGGNSIEIDPSSGTWAQGTTHVVTLSTGITSASTAPLAASFSFSFTTLDNASLLARWVFNNSSVDVSGNGINATVTNGTYDAGSLHEGSHSLALGATSIVDVGTINLGNQFSYTAWVNVTDTSQILTLFANGTAGFSTDGIKVFVNEWSTNNRCIVIESGNGSAGKQILTDPGFVTFGAWFHVAVTIDRSLGEANLYFNGARATTYDSVSSLASNLIRNDFNNNAQLYLNQFPGNNFRFNGNLDDVRFYNLILSPAQIQNIANEN